MPSVELQTTISPVDQTPILTRPLLTEEQLESVILDSLKAQKSWKKVPLEERIAIAEKWMAEFERQRDVLAEEISVQMGR
jgi:acyl-CoA reductase-like NAD-dependent aldehyde dehydrogenase